ncbi:MAG: hypothetical protein JXA67_16495, partial [Micromonosporaceae bacterium]|nr:hypothetical protein [Micromonosporaceae bacterium]
MPQTHAEQPDRSIPACPANDDQAAPDEHPDADAYHCANCGQRLPVCDRCGRVQGKRSGGCGCDDF